MVSVVYVVALYYHISNVQCIYIIRQHETTANFVVESNKYCKFMHCDWVGNQIIIYIISNIGTTQNLSILVVILQLPAMLV